MSNKGIRYTAEKKQEVVDYVIAYNDEHNGRGGVSNAAAKFEISPLTVKNWYEKATGGTVKKASKSKVFLKLSEIQEEIDQKQAELDKLNAQLELYKKQVGL